ncbi:sulfite exporter TauE/SafE family protein [Dactylosporangium aurantiacum]|uniref:Probable membrane transporter protein n=1 Tax=Dactylosporangium aurantiacum TaxID=35754 RepID=A0A9Q9IRN3_9ACTN|nr:sulfite exporter TauE/SafE family protein [Dactylosporangium aurantiacum]MDG6106352.1 sulfite exporter TauE/SafE family protein [Dactylosporangium aurantiacum]UWZ58159.1 sulfite exporter TauE/SafE family protein [Dactylosporangium aurantiacum]
MTGWAAVLVASAAAFALAVLSAVAGFGGGVLLLPVFTALFGLRAAVPMLTLAQLGSNASRAWLNRRELHWPLVGWFAAGAVPCAVAGGLLLAHAPLGPLKRLLGVFLIGVVLWRRRNPHPRKPAERTFTAVGAASGLGSALLGSTGPLTAPFFLAYGLTRAAYIGTEAVSALTLHLSKLTAYGAGDLLTGPVLRYGAALTPATLAGAWVGRKIVGRISDRVFVRFVEAGLITAGLLFVAGL